MGTINTLEGERKEYWVMEGGNNFFVYLSMIEGLAICAMLGWEIFWLKRMYQVLNAMPTAKQLEDMLDMVKSDRDSIKKSLVELVSAFEPLKTMLMGLNGGVGGMIGSLFSSTKE
jgi:hypothetical protein